MGEDVEDRDGSPVSPEEAFTLIGHETRVQILEVLTTTNRANRPVSFSDIRKQLGDIDSAHFNYHLNELVGHYLTRTDDGYDFRRAGRRVTQAIRSGAFTGEPMSDLTPVDQTCPYCDATLQAIYQDECISVYCPSCPGTYGSSNFQEETEVVPDEYGFLGLHLLPPSGVEQRTPTEMVEAAHRWSLIDSLAAADDLCPRCASPFDEWLNVCDDHEYADNSCSHCGNRQAILHSASCTNCTFDQRVPLGIALLDDTDLQSFLTSNGINIFSVGYKTFSSIFKTYDEDIRSFDPLKATLTFTVDGESFGLDVSKDLPVKWRSG